MLKSERKHIILEKVIKERIVSIEDLVQELNSSESTVRRDLDELEAENKLRRIHGGAESLHSLQEEESNKDKAIKVLRARLYDLEQSKAHDAEAELRKSQIGTGDRAEKIRTYNFPQGRVTDHRIKLTLHRLDDILNGDLDEIIDSLTAADQAAKLSKLQEMER